MVRITLAIVAALAAFAAHAQQTVKIGMPLTLSGQFADAANQMLNGAKTYMKMHGDTVAGRKIELITKDVGTSAARRPTWRSACRRNWWCATTSTSSPATC